MKFSLFLLSTAMLFFEYFDEESQLDEYQDHFMENIFLYNIIEGEMGNNDVIHSDNIIVNSTTPLQSSEPQGILQNIIMEEQMTGNLA